MKKKNVTLFIMFFIFNIFMNSFFIENIYNLKILNNMKIVKKSAKEYHEYQWDSEALVYGKILSDKENLKDAKFLQNIFNEEKDYKLNWIFKPNDLNTNKNELLNRKKWIIDDYYQQYGLQGEIFSFLYNNLGIQSKSLLYSINILISSLIFTYIINWILIEFGFLAGIFSFLSLLFSPYLVRIIRNLYWVSWTLYLPFAISIFNEKNKKSYVLIFITTLCGILIKCLNGYEFISTLLISTEIITCYNFFKKKYELKEFIKRGIVIGIGGILGFIMAILLHLKKLNIVYGNFNLAIDKFLTPIKTRTNFGGSISDKIAEGIHPGFEKSLDSSTLKLIGIYIYKKGVILIFPIIVVLFLLILTMKKDDRKEKNRPLLQIIGISFIGTLSWVILAKGHAYHHKHIDYILWSIPFTILVFAYIGKVIDQNRRK